MHTINQSLAATILRLMRSRSWPISCWRWERLILRRSMRAFCSAMLADRSTSHWTQRDVSASRSLPSTSWKIWRICGSDEFPQRASTRRVACWSTVLILDAVLNTGDLQERRVVVLSSERRPPWLARVCACTCMHMRARALTKGLRPLLPKRGLRHKRGQGACFFGEW